MLCFVCGIIDWEIYPARIERKRLLNFLSGLIRVFPGIFPGPAVQIGESTRNWLICRKKCKERGTGKAELTTEDARYMDRLMAGEAVIVDLFGTRTLSPRKIAVRPCAIATYQSAPSDPQHPAGSSIAISPYLINPVKSRGKPH